MTVHNVVKDPERLTMVVTADFDAPLSRVWQVWADPRQLERWWGPPTYPATFVDHDLTVGGQVSYFMTGPEGDRPRGWWRVTAVEPPHSLEFEDGFADDDGEPNAEMPVVTVRVRLTEKHEDLTEMTIETLFPSVEAMEQLIAMGMEEGLTAAIGQIDEILAEVGELR